MTFIYGDQKRAKRGSGTRFSVGGCSCAQDKGKEADMPEQAAQDMSAWRLRYALVLTDSLSSILFDARRNTCHCLLLNYWVRCGGLQVGCFCPILPSRGPSQLLRMSPSSLMRICCQLRALSRFLCTPKAIAF